MSKDLARLALAVVGFSWLAACVATNPTWHGVKPHEERKGAFDRFLVATGSGSARGRTNACQLADEQAERALIELLIDRSETDSEVVAVAGGPSRIRDVLIQFATEAVRVAPRSREVYDDPGRRCFVERRWLLPRHLAAAVRRSIAIPTTEDDAGKEMIRALAFENPDPAPAPPRESGRVAVTPRAALETAYPGWFSRLLNVEDCMTHRLAFVGAPGGTEARWLDLKKTEKGWIIVGDERTHDDGWPEPPRIGWCD